MTYANMNRNISKQYMNYMTKLKYLSFNDKVYEPSSLCPTGRMQGDIRQQALRPMHGATHTG